MRIAVFMGGISPERNVSLHSGLAVATALRQKGHSVTMHDPALGVNCLLQDDISIPTTPPNIEELEQFSITSFLECVSSPCLDGVEIVFNVLHGRYGEDGTMQALLDARGISYTGSRLAASSLAMDKIRSKYVFASEGISTPSSIGIRKESEITHELAQEIRETFRKGFVVKPNDQGSTVGMSILHNPNIDEIITALGLAHQYSEIALIEEFIAGRELTVPILGDQVLPIIEIAAQGGFYDYEHKYTKGLTEYICPAELDEHLTEFIQNLALAAHQSLGCNAYSRVDFLLDEDNMPWCLEVNTLPGMTATSLVPKSALIAGIEFPDLCEKIITLST